MARYSIAMLGVATLPIPLPSHAWSQTAPAQPDAAPRASSKGSQTLVLDTVTVTATKTPERAIDALAGESIVTRPQINTLQPGRVSDILRDVPGVTAQESQNDPGQSINIRGLQDFGRVNVLVDGARQDFQISGHNANGTFYLDPAFIGQADAVRGPVSNIYGSGAIGGVVSFRSLGIEDVLRPGEHAGALQRFEFGTNGAGLLTSTAGGLRFGTTADVFGQVVFRDAGSYRDGSGTKIQDTNSDLIGGSFKLNVRPAEGQQITATALTQDNTFINNGTSNAGTRFSTDVKTQTFTLGYKFLSRDTPLIDFDIKSYYSGAAYRQTVLRPTATYAALGVVPGRQLSDTIGTFGFDVHNTARFATGDVHHALTVGGDAAFDHVTTRDAAGGYVSTLTPSGDRTLAGAFIQNEARWRWLRVVGGVRYDHYALNGDAFSSSGSRFSPRITVGITPMPGLEFYGTYAEGYRAPSITETLISGPHPFPAFNLLPNAALRPETAHNLEAGVNVQYDSVIRAGDSLRAKADVFTNRIDSFIDLMPVGSTYFVPFSPAFPAASCLATPKPFYCVIPVNSYQYVNIASARLSGIEVEGAYDWGAGFFALSATHTEGRNRTTGAYLATVPPDRVSGTLGFRFLDGDLTLSSRLTLVDNSRTGALILAPTKGYGLVDVFASYQYNSDISANLSVLNLFDRRYTQYLDTLTNPGLTAKLGISVRFTAK